MEEGKPNGIFAAVQIRDDNGLGWDDGSGECEEQGILEIKKTLGCGV